VRPDARGSVMLKSPDPLAAPAIRFNFLKSRYDIEALTAGMRLARQITTQPALAPNFAEELLPGSTAMPNLKPRSVRTASPI
jgi:choline dehydrogenase-like flavoprotein